MMRGIRGIKDEEGIRGGSGKMKKVIKRSLLIIMILGVMGCGQQGQEPGKQNGVGSGISGAMMDLGRSAENAFYAFLELISDVLGFTAKVDTKKDEVGAYFSSLGNKLGKASDELEEIAKKTGAGIDKSASSNKILREVVNAAKLTLSVLKEHLDSFKDIGDANKIVDVTSNQQGVTVNTDALKKVYQALKGIVTASITEGVVEPKKSNVAIATANVGGSDAKNGAKVLATGAAGAAAGLNSISSEWGRNISIYC